METKWASLISFGATVDLLKDVLPIDEKLSAETVRNHLHKVADRIDSELGDEQHFFTEGCQNTWEKMPIPKGPIIVGIDGGYVRSREKHRSHFEVMVGKIMPKNQPNRYIGFVQNHDTKPRRRLYQMLKDQGWQENQHITFMMDGGDTVRNLALEMAPVSEYILDWFHITMRITVMGQYAKGLINHNQDEGRKIARLLRQIKGFLWNGNLREASMTIDDLVMDIEFIETNYPSIKAFKKAACEFETYINNNAFMIPNYAERRRYKERVSTGFVESTVNVVVGKRFCKKQQMRWSKSTHLFYFIIISNLCI